MRRLFIFSFLIFISTPAFSAQMPRALGTDSRIRHVLYSPNEVYEVKGSYGYETTIEFASDEVIQAILAGDSIAWQIVHVSNRLFLKPVEQNAKTNATIVTNKRTYYINLSTTPNKLISRMTYLVRFEYPKSPSPTSSGFTKAIEPSQYNFSYELKKDKKSGLIRAFDNGEFTYLQFKDLDDLPAIFLIDENNNESLVNYRIEGPYVVIERIANKFAFRRGKVVGQLINKSFPAVSDSKAFSLKSESSNG